MREPKKIISECKQRQLEIDFYRTRHLYLDECQLIRLKIVNGKTCDLKNKCAQEVYEE